MRVSSDVPKGQNRPTEAKKVSGLHSFGDQSMPWEVKLLPSLELVLNLCRERFLIVVVAFASFCLES